MWIYQITTSTGRKRGAVGYFPTKEEAMEAGKAKAGKNATVNVANLAK